MVKFLFLVMAAIFCFAATSARADEITVTKARIGCLDIQVAGNLTGLVGAACNNKTSCSYQAPTETQYRNAGVQAQTRLFCTQAMEIIYQCGQNEFHTATVPGDAWKNPPAQLACNATTTAPQGLPEGVAGVGKVTVEKARIGCLDIQVAGNLTSLVGAACNNKTSCSYQAPTEAQYRSVGVQALTRLFCRQAMEITYRCGENDDQIITVPGDAWNHSPAQLICNGERIATNRQDVTPPPQGTASELACPMVKLESPDYYIAPRDMLDWAPHSSIGSYTFQGFHPPQPATISVYNSPLTSSVAGAPASTLGANEGRVRDELRAVSKMKDPVHSLCQAAQKFTRNGAASANTPSDQDFGNAFSDLSVTGKAVYAKFKLLHPDEATLSADSGCVGASASSITRALDRAYSVANALRGAHDSSQRQALGWVAVSGEDDQPYRPVNVPSTHFPQFDLKVNVPNFHISVNTRYMIAPAQIDEPKPLTDPRPVAPPVIHGREHSERVTPAVIEALELLPDTTIKLHRQIFFESKPGLAPDAQVILFIHGMDSRLEEAEELTKALHRLGTKNWTIISMDLPTSGYADNIDHSRISPISAVQCHNTPMVDFLEEFIVAFVDTLDGELDGQLKPKIKAIVGGSLGGNMAMRLGRRPNAPWITNVVPWSPASIWPSMVAQHNAVLAGCDTSHNLGGDIGVNQMLKWGGLESRFLPDHETPELRRELFYGGFDWDGGLMVSIFSGANHKPQAQCWFSDKFQCKQQAIMGARLDRQETYDANFRAWHWRLAGEQMAFSHQQHASGTNFPLYLSNTKRMLLFSGYEDTCGALESNTRYVASQMTNTPGYARFLKQTGHSVDTEHPDWVARQIVNFLH